MPSWVVWVIVAIVVIAVIAAIVAASSKKKQERNRTRAGELREQAAAQAAGLQQREAHAKETEARAAEARAEADRKQAEAERLQAEARDRKQTADGYREQHAENLRQADELDPDVDTRHEGYTGPEGLAEHERETHRSDADVTGTGTHRHSGDLADHEGADRETATHETATHETAGHESGHETTGQETTGQHSAETTTVTHPDGRTETVSAPDTDTTDGGTHRA